MHQGLDRDESVPSGPLQARLKTTPAPSLAPRITFTQHFSLSVSFLAHHPIKAPVLASVASCVCLNLSLLCFFRLSPKPSLYPPPLKDLSLLIILTILLHTRLVSSIFNLGFSRAISYTQHAEANWFKEARCACWCWWLWLKLIEEDGKQRCSGCRGSLLFLWTSSVALIIKWVYSSLVRPTQNDF